MKVMKARAIQKGADRGPLRRTHRIEYAMPADRSTDGNAPLLTQKGAKIARAIGGIECESRTAQGKAPGTAWAVSAH